LATRVLQLRFGDKRVPWVWLRGALKRGVSLRGARLGCRVTEGASGRLPRLAWLAPPALSLMPHPQPHPLPSALSPAVLVDPFLVNQLCPLPSVGQPGPLRLWWTSPIPCSFGGPWSGGGASPPSAAHVCTHLTSHLPRLEG